MFEIAGIADGLKPAGTRDGARRGRRRPIEFQRDRRASTRRKSSSRSATAASCRTCCGSWSGKHSRGVTVRASRLRTAMTALTSAAIKAQGARARLRRLRHRAGRATSRSWTFFAEWLARGYAGSMALSRALRAIAAPTSGASLPSARTRHRHGHASTTPIGPIRPSAPIRRARRSRATPGATTITR